MKLNSKRTFIIGLAFFSICAFWQMYDNIVPLILKYRYGISDGISGPIMALDNVLALFMLLYAACAAAGIHEHIPFSGRCTDA